MSGNERPSIDELYELMRRQQGRIDKLERAMARPEGAADPPDGITALAVVEQPEPPGRTLSRGRLLRNAAVGAAGVAGGALLADPSIASAATGTFSSATSTPTVTVTNTGTGQGLTAASASSSATILGSNTGSGAGVNGQTSSTGVSASAVKGTLTATTLGASAAAVRGVASGTGATSAAVAGAHSANGYGVLGTSAKGIGVEGDSASTADSAMAVHGLISSTAPGGFSAGVFGQNNGAGGNGIGVHGSQNGSGWGVYGTAPSGIGLYGTSESGTGVEGFSSTGPGVSGVSDGAAGVAAYSYSAEDSAIALYAYMGGDPPGAGTTAVYGTNIDTSSSGIGVYGLEAGDGYGVWGQCDGSGGYGVYGSSEDGYGVYCTGGTYALYAAGNFAASGTKSAVVELSNELRTFYCTESPECWFEDFGSASLKSGSASVSLEPLFAESVETDDYYVFLSPEGNCKGLFVTNKSATGFQVQELEGGTSSITFAYRIVALRADVDAPRLAVAPAITSPKSVAPKVAASPRATLTPTQ